MNFCLIFFQLMPSHIIWQNIRSFIQNHPSTEALNVCFNNPLFRSSSFNVVRCGWGSHGGQWEANGTVKWEHLAQQFNDAVFKVMDGAPRSRSLNCPLYNRHTMHTHIPRQKQMSTQRVHVNYSTSSERLQRDATGPGFRHIEYKQKTARHERGSVPWWTVECRMTVTQTWVNNKVNI